ncbi:MAG TPA: hypothetical protein EYP85_04655 [Armatimonadetes bacterium]|nr:hypothetical protein [Armatimonadota bacterium]
MTQLRLFNPHDLGTNVLTEVSLTSERQRLEEKFAPLLREEFHLARLVSYGGNKEVPILRLYRYKEAFAFHFVEEFIQRFGLTGRDCLFDPFCGMGTTLFAGMQKGIPTVGIDKLPIAVFVAQTFLLFFSLKEGELRSTFAELKNRVRHADLAPIASDVAIMKVAFPPENLIALRQWKKVIDALEPPLRDVFLLLFFSILEPCSYTSKDGQFLRLNRKKRVGEPEELLERKVSEAERDLQLLKQLWPHEKAVAPKVCLGDARDLGDISFPQRPTAIITSPPYANRYDYTRTYSLELCFHFVSNFEELKSLRFNILRSHIESKVDNSEEPPHPAVKEVVDILRSQRKELNNPRIPDMLTGYFVDMWRVVQEWARILAPGARVAMVVDNVRFAGELLPVDLVLSEMAEKTGFHVWEILVARYKGNSSQQMRKYGRVPVRESVVVWQKEQ